MEIYPASKKALLVPNLETRRAFLENLTVVPLQFPSAKKGTYWDAITDIKPTHPTQTFSGE